MFPIWSKSVYKEFTGERLNLPTKTLAAVFDSDGSNGYTFSGGASLVTNTLSGQTLEVHDIALAGKGVPLHITPRSITTLIGREDVHKNCGLSGVGD